MFLSVLSVLTTTPAHAVVYAGNPNFEFYVQRPSADLTEGLGHLNRVRVFECGTLDYTDYVVDEDIDPVAGFTLTIAGGDLCGATLVWADDVLLKGYDGGTFVLAYTDNTTLVQFGTPIEPVTLSPIEIVSGSPGGTNPRLYATVQ